MKKIVTGILLCLFISCTSEQTPDFEYTISHHVKDSIASLKIRLTFKADNTGKTILLFQDKAWGQDSLHNVITSMKLLNAEGVVTKNRDSNWVEIEHSKDLKIVDFEYTLQQDTEGDLETIETYRPIIQPNYFHVFSHNALMLPRDVLKLSGDHFNVSINWEGFSEEFNLQNSFGSKKEQQLIENISEEEFHSAVFVGGDFRIHKLNIENNEVAFAIRGDWEVIEKDSILINMLEKTVTAQRELWKDHTQKYFSVTMIPTIMERGSGFQGTGLTNSFATNATNNKYLEISGLVYLFNHELQHNWTGHIIKNEDEEKQYWFSEGFTEYYAFKNIARNQIYNFDKQYFIENLNRLVQSLFTSPVREMPNSEMNYDNFWSGMEGVQKLPYYRGAMFAFYLDQQIKKDTDAKQNLDDLMLTIKNDAVNNDQKLNSSYFITKANEFLKEDLTPFFNTHIEEGKLFDMAQLFTDFGFDFLPTSEAYFKGFELSNDKRSIVFVDSESKAYKAGLRKGDKITSYSIYRGRTDLKTKITVRRNKKEISINFFPVKEMDIPQLKVSEHNLNRLSF